MILAKIGGWVRALRSAMKSWRAVWRRHWEPVAVIAGLLCFALGSQGFHIFQRWDHPLYDAGLKLFERSPLDEIAIVAIDEHSLDQLGRWPWSRRVHAALIDRLTAADAKAVGFDVVFAEASSDDPGADQALAQAIARNGRIVLPVFPESPRAGDGLEVTAPLPALARAAGELGHVDVEMDDDGIARRVYLQAGMGSVTWPAFPLAMLAVATPDAPLYLTGERNPNGPTSRPHLWTRDYRIMIPFAGPPGHFRQISYLEVLRDSKLANSLRDKLVLVGTTAAGLNYRFVTPVSGGAEPMSTVEFHANVLDTLLRQMAIQPLGSFASAALTAFIVLFAASACWFLSPRAALLATLSSAVATAALSVGLLKFAGLWYPPVSVLVSLALSYPINSWRRLAAVARALHNEKERTSATLNSIGDAVIATDPQGQIVYMNPIAENLTGYALTEIKGQPLADVMSLTSEYGVAGNLSTELNDCLNHACAVKLPNHQFLTSRTGSEYAVRLSASPIFQHGGTIGGVVVALSDVSATVEVTRKMTFLATHDPLTELPNRNLLQDRLTQAIAHARREDSSFAVLLVDLDGFKKINDGLGHAVGDLVLKDVAERLRSAVREIDTAARWGGDEFVVLLERLAHEEDATEITTRMLQILAMPFFYGGQTLFVTPSIGISLFPKDGMDADALLSRADAAMYRVKESGCNHFRYYSRDMNDRARERLELEKEMRFALAEGGFELFYQPQVAIKSGRIVGVEALIRWHHPSKGLIVPGQFIPLAEEIGLINEIGRWVIQQACRQIRAWRDAQLPPIYVAVNLSPRQFQQSDLFEIIHGALMACAIDPAALKLEITESLVMKDIGLVAATLNALRVLGVSVSIDDFGTGYSSLSLLTRLPVDQLKIDKSFVRDVTTNSDHEAIARTVIVLAHNMSMQVVAEGVETEAQASFLRELGCDILQGYFFSHPVTADTVNQMLADVTGMLGKKLPGAAASDETAGSGQPR